MAAASDSPIPSRAFWAKDNDHLKDLTGIVDRDEQRWIGGGAFGDVYRGIWRANRPEGEQVEVVVKVLRSTGAIEQNEAGVKRMKVSETLPFAVFLGFMGDILGTKKRIESLANPPTQKYSSFRWNYPHLRSAPIHRLRLDAAGFVLCYALVEAIEGLNVFLGTLRAFLTKNPGHSRDNLAIDIAEGLKYLHGEVQEIFFTGRLTR